MIKKLCLSNRILRHSFLWDARGIAFFVLLLALLWFYVFFDIVNGWLLFVIIVLLFIGMLVWPYKKQQVHMKEVQRERDEQASIILDAIMEDRQVPDFVLYLRPFKSTATLGKHEPKRQAERDASVLPAELSHGDLETLLADEFWPPPILGIGRPGEHFGIGRHPASQSEWQDIVLRLIRGAGFIIVVPSHQEGTLWELKQLVTQRLIHRCVFYLEPAGNGEEAADWSKACDALKQIGLHVPYVLHNNEDKRYVGSLVKCFTEVPICARMDIGYTLKFSESNVKLTGGILQRLCTKKFHYAIQNQIREMADDEITMISLGNDTQIPVRISRGD